ncbi:hypothetical protein OPU71_18870 [Niveibacterium sp. 24ML]|uniref:hypothetical protein n=1 Tax=Niveibacterium sp. 24ML TaxID=2985512 RepID=UPI00226FC17B|nr:hypothetical protein [Niveibacterium sp. 24ML]MCX9158191.1 hypothetical protein [Niveibacterium sp. 24ML]
MNTTIRNMAAILMGLPAVAMAAETTARDRNVNQQTRIEQGLERGTLNVREAARLENMQSNVERMQAHAARDGLVTGKEAARIDQAQDAASNSIYTQKHDAQRGNPNTASSQRMQASVERNINQQTRIRNGVADGSMTLHEASRMQGQQAHGNRVLARTGADGHLGRYEQQRVASIDDRQSRHIWRQRHDAQGK